MSRLCRHYFFSVPLLLVVLIMTSCGHQEDEQEYVARVYDAYLSQADLAAHIPATASSDDSLKRAQVFVNNWVKEQVVLHKAQFNISEDDSRFQSKLDAYLQDLIIYEYERELVSQQLDTVVSLQEQQEFYAVNVANFVLKESVARVRLLVVPEDTEGLNEIAPKFKSYSEEDSLDILNYTARHDLLLRDEPALWLSQQYILEIVPLSLAYFEAQVKRKSDFDKNSEGMRYLLHIREFRASDESAPLAMEAGRIRSIIINNRRKNLLRKMRDGLFNDAIAKDEIEIRS